MSRAFIRFAAKKLSAGQNESRLLNFSRRAAFISVALGTMTLIISVSVLGGYEKALKENAVKFNAHIKATSYSGKALPDYPSAIGKIKRSFPDNVTAVDPVIERPLIIRKKGFIDGALIKGVNDDAASFRMIREGDFSGKKSFSSDSAREVIVSRRLARKAGVGIGDTLIAYCVLEQQGEGFPRSVIRGMRVIGIYSTGLAEYDDMVIFAAFATAAMLFEYPANACTGLEVTTRDVNAAPGLVRSMEEKVGYPYFFNDVFRIQRAAFIWIEIQKEPVPLVLGLISAVAVLNIITALLIAVVEKTSTIGILRSLGARRKDIIGIFVRQGLQLGIWGTLTGAMAALAFCLLQVQYKLIRLRGDIYFLDSLPIDLSLSDFVIVISSSVFLSVLATFVPALIAGRIVPLRIIRWQ